MIHFPRASLKSLHHNCSKIKSSFLRYGLSVPVHFHFGFYAQTTSKDFVKSAPDQSRFGASQPLAVFYFSNVAL